MITQTIGRKLRQYRQKQGYSQEALADRAGLHPTYIGQVEAGGEEHHRRDAGQNYRGLGDSHYRRV